MKIFYVAFFSLFSFSDLKTFVFVSILLFKQMYCLFLPFSYPIYMNQIDIFYTFPSRNCLFSRYTVYSEMKKKVENLFKLIADAT